MSNLDFTVEEVMAVALSREFGPFEHGFIGLGTGGRAFTLAVGVPTVAIHLAHAQGKDFIAQYGVMFEPVISETPPSFADPYLLNWRSRALIPVDLCLDTFRRGKMTCSFISGAQIDPYGNLNSVVIGDHDRPKVRLTGPIAQADHAAYARRTYPILPHDKRVFVEKVDFISAVGYGDGPGYREKYGLKGGGPGKVITTRAVLGFDPDTKRMRLESVHPGVTVEEVVENTGFELIIPPNVPETTPPTEEDLRLIRTQIDPHGYFLQAKVR